MIHQVSTVSLNLRSEPRVTPTNRIATLPQGHQVEKVADASPGWWTVRTTLNGATLAGFAASRFLVLQASAPPAQPGTRSVHLQENRPDVMRSVTSRRAFPFGEVNAPRRN